MPDSPPLYSKHQGKTVRSDGLYTPPDACVPSTLAVQEVEQLYQPGYKTLMECLGHRRGTFGSCPGPRAIVRDSGADLVKIGRIKRKEV